MQFSRGTRSTISSVSMLNLKSHQLKYMLMLWSIKQLAFSACITCVTYCSNFLIRGSLCDLGFVCPLQDVALHQCLPLGRLSLAFPDPRWFPPSLLCRLAIFCMVVLLISSLSLVATLCSVWSTYVERIVPRKLNLLSRYKRILCKTVFFQSDLV